MQSAECGIRSAEWRNGTMCRFYKVINDLKVVNDFNDLYLTTNEKRKHPHTEPCKGDQKTCTNSKGEYIGRMRRHFKRNRC